MGSWRQRILDDLQYGISPTTVVHDPDKLLLEENLLAEISDRGFDVVRYEDPVAFRFQYETYYRSTQSSISHRSSDRQRELIVLIDEENGEGVPFDLINCSRQLNYSLKELFPKLSSPVLAELDISLLDNLKEAERYFNGETVFGETLTRNHVLRFCFRVLPEQLGTDVELMQMLFSNSLRSYSIPKGLIAYLLNLLRQNPIFADWPLEKILDSQHEFKLFLEEQWKLHIDGLVGRASAKSLVPFENPEIQIYMDTFFWEGVLKLVKVENPLDLPKYARVGLVADGSSGILNRFHGLAHELTNKIAQGCTNHTEWQCVARLWGELVYWRWHADSKFSGEQEDEFNCLRDKIQSSFQDWMFKKFGALHNQAYLSSPVMLHHIAPFIAHRQNVENLDKVALVIFDGLAIDQWVILRNYFQLRKANWSFEESQVFSWVPTITTIARQSIFAAEMPMFFEKSINSTSKEPKHWERFWTNKDRSKNQISYVKILSDDFSELQECCDDPSISNLGVVVNKPDQLVHKQVLGTRGLHADIHVWKDSALQIVDYLLEAGFEIFISSDHGNVEARGIGKPNDGVLVKTDGSRARIYENDHVMEQASHEFPNTIQWPSIGLPPGKHVLLPDHKSAFSHKNQLVVSHGGISIEEVIVPFIRLKTLV